MPRHAETVKMDKCPGLWGFQNLLNQIQYKVKCNTYILQYQKDNLVKVLYIHIKYGYILKFIWIAFVFFLPIAIVKSWISKYI
jgi:hypothetical protein